MYVTYVYDTSGKLHCTFTDATSRKKYEVSLRPESAEDLKKNYEQIEHILIDLWYYDTDIINLK